MQTYSAPLRNKKFFDTTVKTRFESIRLQAGPLMGLGDVAEASVPEMTLVSAPAERRGDQHAQLHSEACPRLDQSVCGGQSGLRTAFCPTAAVAAVPADGRFRIEHPAGAAGVFLDIGPAGEVRGAGTIPTERKLMEGRIFARPH